MGDVWLKGLKRLKGVKIVKGVFEAAMNSPYLCSPSLCVEKDNGGIEDLLDGQDDFVIEEENTILKATLNTIPRFSTLSA